MNDPHAPEVEIARLGRHGDGADAAGTVFAPFTLPGERIRGRLAQGRIEAPEILVPSPHRVAPPCPAFGHCGGCALMHGQDAFLADWKRARLATALASHGIETEILPTAVSPPASRRRATLSARRTRTGLVLGFHARRGAEIIPLDACRVLAPEIVAARAALAEVAALGASRKGEPKLAVTLTETGLDVTLEGTKPLDGPTRLAAAALAASAGLARLSWGGEPVAAPRTPVLTMGLARLTPPPGGFLQATREGEAALLAFVRQALGPARRVADLFAGAGTFALPLAETAEVHAVESDAPHLAALEAAWRGAGGRLKRITLERRDLFRRPLRPEELKRIDAAVFDPPRAGAAAQSEQLAKAPLARLAAVSCNPETFARDARTLIDGGWRLDRALPVDQFRWSPHVELAAAFSRP